MIPAIDLAARFDALTDHWSPKVVGRVNDQFIKIAKLKGEFVWHAHDDEDEMFLVVRGRLRIQFEDGETMLDEGQCLVVPKGVRHKPVADKECWVVLIETVTTAHTGGEQTPLTRSIEDQLA
ncbi:MAG: cupin domain-containing protein [Inquilinaceae bacterium]